MLKGPSTNWIVGTKSPIGVDSKTVIIDKLMESGSPTYPDSTDLSKAVPTTPAYNNDSLTLSLPVVNGQQMTWSDVDWLALYCRKITLLFMHVDIPKDFARRQLCAASTSSLLLEKKINLTNNPESPGEVSHCQITSDPTNNLRPGLWLCPISVGHGGATYRALLQRSW